MSKHLALAFLPLALALTGCPNNSQNQGDAFGYDVVPVDLGPDAPTGAPFCSLPGSDVSGAGVPEGFCIRRFAQINEPRVLAFAPNGDLFVAAPSSPAAGGAMGGPAAIVVLSDDNHDGMAEQTTFASGLSDVHGLAFGPGALYFTTEHAVWSTPYAAGQRQEMTGARTMVAAFDMMDAERWTHGLAYSPGGELYATQGVYSALTCPDTVRNGTIQRMNAPSGPQLVASGFRNPMYIRCHYADDTCIASELGDDGGGTWMPPAHEKLVVVRASTNYGFPCCTTRSVSTQYNDGSFDCGMVAQEDATFPLNDTPFGLDWERGMWPQPFNGALVVALHGSFYSNPVWQGARIVFAPTDPVTHAPSGAFQDLVRGFGPNGSPLERPADVAFASDGRLFFSDDMGNAVYWVAPSTLRMR